MSKTGRAIAVAGVGIGLLAAKPEKLRQPGGVRSGFRAVMDGAAKKARLVMAGMRGFGNRPRQARFQQEQSRGDADHDGVTAEHLQELRRAEAAGKHTGRTPCGGSRRTAAKAGRLSRE